MTFELAKEYPNLNAELRSRKQSITTLTKIPQRKEPRDARQSHHVNPSNNAPLRRVSSVVAIKEDVHADRKCQEASPEVHHAIKPIPSQGKGREVPLQSNPGHGGMLLQSQSAPSLHVPSASKQRNAPFPTNFHVPLEMQQLPSILLCQGRVRPRYARRNQSVHCRLPLPSSLGFGVDMPMNQAVDTPTNEIPQTIDREMGCFLTEIELDSEYIPVANGLAFAAYQLYAVNEVKKAIESFRHVLRLVEDLDDIPLQALIHHHIGTAEKELGEFDSSIASQTKCIQLAQSVQNIKLQGRGYKGMGVVYVSTQQYQRAFEYHVKCLTIATTENDMELASRSHANLGNVYTAQHQYTDAILSHTRDLTLSTQLNSYTGMARAHNNLALVFNKMNDIQQKRKHEEESLAFGTSPYSHDMMYHSQDVVGNIYLQLDSAGISHAMIKQTGRALIDIVRANT